MTKQKAVEILRAKKKDMAHTDNEFYEAIMVAIRFLENEINHQQENNDILTDYEEFMASRYKGE